MGSSTAVLKKAIQSVTKGDQPGVTDQDLVRRFVGGKDQAAFAMLVGRHTGLVLGVCRRSLPTVQDAEDACQATFLILAQKAKSIRWQTSVASWLYVTARKVAHNARVAAQRRVRREAKAAVPEVVQPLDRMTGRELLAMLDEELERLPPRYRDPLVLCYLEGLTRDEAALRLGLPVKTLHSRIGRGRKKLHDALTKGGCALGAGLLAFAATSPAGASPPRLVQAILATASGSAPKAVADLAKGVTVNGIIHKVGLALVAAVGITMLGIGLSSLTALAAGQVPDKAAPAAPDKPAARDAKPAPDRPKEITVSGQVLGPDGKPFVGATVACPSSGKAEATVTTGADGRFLLGFTPRDPRDAVTVTATAKGHGPDWAVLKDSGKDGEVTLQLTADDVPFTGRIASLENQPLKGVAVEVVRIGKEGPRNLVPLNLGNRKLMERKRELAIRLLLRMDQFDDSDLITVSGDVVVTKTKAATDADGKFTLTGFGRDRMIEVRVSGPNVETRRFWVITRPGGAKEGIEKTHLYPPDGMILLAPSRPLVGTVRDAKTGKPVAGVTVSEVQSSAPKAVTDENGHYRIEGVKKQKSYFLNVVGGQGLPLFVSGAREVADTGGLGALETNLTVEQGLELTGRVIDKTTGKPVAADVYFLPADDNPSVKDLPTDRVRFTSGQTDRNGRFFLTVWPGKGALTVRVREEGPYPPVEAERILNGLNIGGPVAAPAQAVVPIDADRSRPESLAVSIPLEPGLIRKGTVVGPDEQPLAGALGAGVLIGEFTDRLATPEFTLTPMRAGVKRLLVFFHDDKKLGAVQVVEGTSADPFTVKLQPLGAVTGEVRKGDKEPWPGLTVTAIPVPDDVRYENLSRENFRFQGVSSTRHVPWWDWTKRTAKTDAKGGFRLDGLLPGRDYHIYVSDGDLGEKGTLVMQSKATAPAGQTLDLGVLKKDDPE